MKEQAAKGTHDKVKEMINVLPVTGEALRVLDAPCGFGGMATFLNSRNYAVTALDIIPPEDLDSNIRTLKYDLNETLPFEDDSFDLCVAVEGIEHIERPADFFHELARVLKRGGDMIVSTPNTESLHSRFRAFRNGYPKHFGPVSETERLSGHIHPIDRVFIERHRRVANLKIQSITTNNLDGKRFPWPILSRLMTRQLPKMYRDENILYGDILIYHFVKE
ncbi:MAG: methyltransferase domain-containing protein [Deltaproteobacteria bacterium]|nr:methyltransferase domain-containing protein [Deltaproteobacteria bacterium]